MSLLKSFITPLVLLCGIFVIVKTQFLIPTLWEADGYYHIRMAEFIKDNGVQKQLPQAKFSFFATRFADKDFLYHVLLIPFTFFPSLFFGAKVAAAFFTVALFLAYFYVLRRYASPKLIPIFLALFLCSDHFLSALSRPRPMILAIALMILGIHFLIQKRYWSVCILTFLYSFLHITALLMVFIALLIELVKKFSSTKSPIEFRNIGGACLGLILGYLLHPHFPNNLLFIKLNLFLVPYYAAKGGVLELGGEFFPILTRDLLFGYPALFALLFTLIFFTMVYQKQIRLETKLFFFCSVPFFLGALTSQRYLIHGYPILLLWLAAHFSDLMQEPSLTQSPQNSPLKRIAGWGLASILVVVFALSTAQKTRQNATIENIVNSHYERVAAWFQNNVPPGETIFHANWSDSQYFIGLNPQNNYFVTLDPIYMYAWNEKLYLLYRDVAHGRTNDPYTPLKETFGVRYGYVGKNYFGRLIYQITQDKRFQIVGEDQLGIIFKIL
ncbi:MAG: hypothetical protein HYY07_03040 [Elusimicrobia bacterium]|nr:hypothetical protein [Elusimicrobiota bacterium]